MIDSQTLGRRIVLFALVMLGVAAPAFATNWSWVHPRPTGGELGPAHFVDASTGWVYSITGRIYRTVDGGAAWQETELDTSQVVEMMMDPSSAMSFVDATHGWAMVTEGRFDAPTGSAVYRTVDGATWSQAAAFTDPYGLVVEFADASVGYALTASAVDTLPNASMNVRRTTNGGILWNTIYTSALRTAVIDASAVTGSIVFAALDSFVLDPGGDVEFAAPSRIIHTADAGATWDTVRVDTSAGGITHVKFFDASNGWIAGGAGKMFWTSDGGATWNPAPPPGLGPRATILSMSFFSATQGWIVLEPDTNAATIAYATADRGASWTEPAPTPSLNRTRGVFALGPNDVWLTGWGGTLNSLAPGGTSWIDHVTRATSDPLVGAVFSDGLNGWMVTEWGELLHSNDGGCSWALEAIPTSALDVAATDANHVWVCGYGGNVFFNGGSGWVQQFTGSFLNLFGIWANSPTDVVAVGDLGTILRFDGVTWTADPQSGVITTYQLNDVWAYGSWVFAVGEGGRIVYTDGTTWNLVSTSTVRFNAVWGIDNNNVWAVGSGGDIWYFDGAFWSPETAPNTWELYGVAGAFGAQVLAVGDRGTVLRYNGASWTNDPTATGQTLRCVAYNPASRIAYAGGYNGTLVASQQRPASCAVTAVAFSAVSARPTDGAVALSWRIDARTPAFGFNVYRAEGAALGPAAARGNDGFARLNTAALPSGAEGMFRDTAVRPGATYRYRVGAIDADGEAFSPVATATLPAARVTLEQNTPNPFNPTTSIAFALPLPARVRLAVYDVSGRRVRTLIDAARPAGRQAVLWNGRDNAGNLVGSGVYFYRLRSGKTSITRKLVLLK